MNLLRKLLYRIGFYKPYMIYRFEDDKLYRQKKDLWGNVFWKVDDPMLNLLFKMNEGQQCRVLYTDYCSIGSKCLYLFSKGKNMSIYSCENILVEIDVDYASMLGYYPKNLYYTKTYE